MKASVHTASPEFGLHLGLSSGQGSSVTTWQLPTSRHPWPQTQAHVRICMSRVHLKQGDSRQPVAYMPFGHQGHADAEGHQGWEARGAMHSGTGHRILPPQEGGACAGTVLWGMASLNSRVGGTNHEYVRLFLSRVSKQVELVTLPCSKSTKCEVVCRRLQPSRAPRVEEAGWEG